MRQGRGLPKDYNPFLTIDNKGVDDDTLEKIAPDYFRFDSAADLPEANPRPNVPWLLQEDAEKLVRKLVAGNQAGNFAVKEECAHIIPKDLRKSVRVAKVLVDIRYDGESISEDMCYFLEN